MNGLSIFNDLSVLNDNFSILNNNFSILNNDEINVFILNSDEIYHWEGLEEEAQPMVNLQKFDNPAEEICEKFDRNNFYGVYQMIFETLEDSDFIVSIGLDEIEEPSFIPSILRGKILPSRNTNRIASRTRFLSW